MTKPKIAKKPNDQLAAFRKAARELGTDENEEHFHEALWQIATAKPQHYQEGHASLIRQVKFSQAKSKNYLSSSRLFPIVPIFSS
jgi:hypothetical protein